MKAARILVLGIALAAGGAAAHLVSGGDAPKPEPAPAPVVQHFPPADVLTAKGDIGMGSAVTAQDHTPAALRSPLDASKAVEARDNEDRGRGDINTVRFGVTTTSR